jgi:hypothetical protein
MLRTEANSFPPHRVRVWSFYEHAWFALRRAGYDVGGTTTSERAVAAHRVLTDVILRDASRLNVPVIWYEDIFNDPRAVLATLRTVTEVSDDLIRGIETTGFKRAREVA